VIQIALSTTHVEREQCAGVMAVSAPWTTLGIGFERALATVSMPERELYVATVDGRFAGFALVAMQGVLSGYLQAIAVAPGFRGMGVGAQLLQFVEARVFREKPNVFLFVSSFNTGAQRFYEAHGYEFVGEVRDFLVSGHGERLMRKTLGPLLAWRARSDGER
jgi:ribosomal protein S18 acetylase RimI-like enzyme